MLLHCRPSDVDCMETALMWNCCWAKQCLIWNKSYAIDERERVGGAFLGAISRPWKIYPELLGCSTGQGGHPFPRELPLLAPGQQKRKEKLISVRPWQWKCHFFLLFWFLGMLYLHFFSLFLSLGQNLPRRAGRVLFGMLNQEQPVPYQFSVSRGGREGREEGGGSWPNPLQQRLQSRVGIQGSALLSVHSFALATSGLKVGF